MGSDPWTENDLLKLNKQRASVIDRLTKTMSKKPSIVFAAKLEFGVPQIDFVTVDHNRNTTGYILRLPVKDGEINTLPYFQGFGEAMFLTDQMLDESFLIVPEIELSDNTPFTRSPDPLYRLRKGAYESGISTFDRDFNVKVVVEPRGSVAKQFQRLKIELLESIQVYGEAVVEKDKKEPYETWRKWVDEEIASIGNKKILDNETASIIVEKMLNEKNYRSIKMELVEGEIKAKPRPIPVFNVKGTGLFLGEEKPFSMQLSRISGIPIKRDY